MLQPIILRSTTVVAHLISLTVAILVLRADFRRRRLAFLQSTKLPLLSMLDLATPAITAGVAGEMLVALIVDSRGVLPLFSPLALSILAVCAIFTVLWSEGRRQIQFQRPRGTILGEWLILSGVALLLGSSLFKLLPGLPHGRTVNAIGGLTLLLGCASIALIVPPFMHKYEGLRILDHVAGNEAFEQPEYTPPTPECPRPDLWKMIDSQTTEVEVLDLLKALVLAVKPNLVVETGTFLGHGTLKLAEGLRENGFGKVITIEYDPKIHAQAKERFEKSGLAKWIEARNESSLETQIDGTIDILFSDSHLATREQEIRRLLPQLGPSSLLIVHDSSSYFQVVREAALRLEREGLISVILLPTPRGVVLAQKRENRK